MPFLVSFGNYICMELITKRKEHPLVRERALEHGLGFPCDEELIMLILGSGTRQMPVEVMARKIVEMLDASNDDEIVERLLRIRGIGAGKALSIAAALELGKRRSCHLGARIESPCQIVPFVKNYAMSPKEHFLMVTLDGGQKIIKIHVVSVGTLNRSLIHPREVFVEAIKDNASAMILCHNHPSGSCEPSDDDIEATKTLLKAAEIIGIEILDHLIVSCESYFSFFENKVLFCN